LSVSKLLINNQPVQGPVIFPKKVRSPFKADAGENQLIDVGGCALISAKQLSEPAIYNWYDKNRQLIHSGISFQINSSVSEKITLEVIAKSDGFKDYDEIEVEINQNLINNISPNPSSNNILVEYVIEENRSASIMVISTNYLSESSNIYILDNTMSSISINLSSYPSGLYTIALIIDDSIVDAKALIIQ